MVESTTTLAQYAGNNSAATPYPTQFFFKENSWVRVRVLFPDGTEGTLSQDDDYTVTGAGEPGGGEIVTTTPFNSTHTITIYRVVPLTQLLELGYNDRPPSQLLEDALDKLTYIAQQIGDGGEGSPMRFPVSEPVSNNKTLPAPINRKNSVIFFNEDDGEMETISLSDLALKLSVSIEAEILDDIQRAETAANEAEASATAAAASAASAATAAAGFAGFKDSAATAYTVIQDDRLKRLRFSNAGAITVDFPDGLTAPFACEVESTGGGTITITANGARTVSGMLSFTSGVVSVALNGSVYESAAGGEINTISSVGTGTSLVEGKSGSDLRVRSISVFGGFSLVEASTVKLLMRSQLHAYTLAHIDAYAITDLQVILRLDDIFRGLAGQASSNSIRGTAWTTLSGDLVPGLVTGHIFLTEASAGSGTTVACLKNSKPGTIVGGASRGSTGLALDGSTQYVTLPSRVLNNSEQWTAIIGVINAVSQGNETFFAQNGGGSGRHTFLYQENTGSPANQVGCFMNDGSSVTVYTGATENSANQRMFATRQVTTTLKAYKDGSATAANTTAHTPAATVENSNASYGATSLGSNKFGGTLLFGLFFNTAIPEADMPLIRTLFNNALDQLSLA